MIVCGVEEPLSANEHLHALDEQSSRIVLSRFANESLNRYIFAWIDGAAQAAAALSSVAQAVQRQLTGRAAWVAAWSAQAAAGTVDEALRSGLAHRARVLASKRRREGWAVGQARGVYLATKSVGTLEASELDLSRFDPRFDGRLLVFGEAPLAHQLVEGPPYAFLQSLAARGEPAPSREFSAWLAVVGLSIAYFLIDERERHFLVAISPHRLRLDEMVAAGVVQRVWSGPEAGRIWRG